MSANTTKEEFISNDIKKAVKELKGEVPKENSRNDDTNSLYNDIKNELNVQIQNPVDTSFIKNVNNQVLVEFLSPEIRSNEKSKRRYKYFLIILLFMFLIVQFIAIYSISTKIISYCFLESANESIAKSLLAFASAYITSVVVELIAILNYIVKNVFDTSIVKLVEIFKENENLSFK